MLEDEGLKKLSRIVRQYMEEYQKEDRSSETSDFEGHLSSPESNTDEILPAAVRFGLYPSQKLKTTDDRSFSTDCIETHDTVAKLSSPNSLPQLSNILMASVLHIDESSAQYTDQRRLLEESGPRCNWECVPLETRQVFCPLLDDIDPLGRDYRALAETLGIPEQTMKQIQEFPLRKPSMTESILMYTCSCRRRHGEHLSILEVLAIVEHPGIIGNEEAANILIDMLKEFGHHRPYETSTFDFGVPRAVLIHRTTLAKAHNDLRTLMNPGEIAKGLEGTLTRDDVDDVLRCADDKVFNYTKAADLLCYKLMHLKDPSWYDAFKNILEDTDSDSLPALVLSESQSEIVRYPVFSHDKGDFTICEIEDEDHDEEDLTDIFASHTEKCPAKDASQKGKKSTRAHANIPNVSMDNAPSHLDDLARRIRPRWRQIAQKVGFDDLQCKQFQGSDDPDDWRPASRMLQALSHVEVVDSDWKESLIQVLQDIDMDNLVKDVQELKMN